VSLFKSFKLLAMTATMSMGLILAGCETTDGPLITEDLITKVDDTSPLSVRVKQALRNSPQTASLRFDVTQASDDTVKISGSVSVQWM